MTSTKRDPVAQDRGRPSLARNKNCTGLAGKMNSRPDHGETSYRGSGRLTGRKALITGGDFRHGPRGGDRLCPRRRRRGDRLSALRETGRKGSHRADQAEGRRAVALPGDSSEEVLLQNARGRGGS